ncbi:SpoIIE family protein phosphatase [Tepidibacter sp. Z1-5]|uniref:SpoIIE family protein phosphatase n=1 Tax=Tepidibacter sp. Z1-5 TaxID=3134138 RepID=UPI0030C4399C
MGKIKFTNKVRVKITFAMILCSVITALLISSISVFINYNFSKREVFEKLTLLSQSHSNEFNSDFKSIENSVNIINQYISATFDIDKFNEKHNFYINEYEQNMDSIIKKVAQISNKDQGINIKSGIEAIYFTFNPELTGDVHEIWYADKEGNEVLEKLDSDPDPNDPYIEWFYPENKEMSWYYNTIKKKNGIWSEPYDETDLGINIISYTQAIFKDDLLIGVVGIDINTNQMRDTIKNIKIYDSGYAFLMNENYDFLIHRDFKVKDNLKSIYNQKLKFLSQEIEKKDSGIIEYKSNKKGEILGYSYLNNGWILAFIVPTSEVYSSLKIQIVLTMIIVFLSICMVMLIALYIGKTISKPILKITHIIKNTADFNFNDEICLKNLIENKDEIGIMAKEVCNMRKILKETGVHKAARMQMKYLQEEFPLYNKANMDVLYVPAKTVSGDFYHIEVIDDDFVIGVICDVSGKGVSAGLSTLAFNILFHEAILHNQNSIDILNDLNKKVAKFLGETYIAACCFSLDFKNNIANIAGAGVSQFMYVSDKEYCQEKIIKGAFLGMFEDSKFEQEIINFKSGDKFYFFTDGLDFIVDDEKVSKDLIQRFNNGDLVSFLNNNLGFIQADNEFIVDDCTLIKIEIK